MKARVIAALCSIAISGCVSQPINIQAHVAPLSPYQTTDCAVLATDVARIDEQLHGLNELQRKAAKADVVWVSVGLFLFWPALFGVLSTDDHEAEIATLLGEQSAMLTVSAQRPCPII